MKQKIIKLVHALCSVLSVFVLVTPVTVREIVLYLFSGIILSGLVCLFYDKLQWREGLHKKVLILDLIIVVLLIYDFYARWIPSSTVAVIAELLHLSATTFLSIVTCILGAMAISTVNWILWKIREYSEKFISKKGNKENIYKYFFIVFIVLLQYLSLQYSALQSLEKIFRQDVFVFIFNILIILAINMLAVLILQKWKYALCVTSFLIGIWSIANYYVILFHGSPLYISELNNIKTACAVLFSYTYNISIPVILAVLILIAEFVYIFKYVSTANLFSIWKRLLIRFGTLCVCSLLIYIIFKNVWEFESSWTSWKDNIINKGFMVCVMEDINGSANPIIEPAGYDVEYLPDRKMSGGYDTDSEDLPDIIMILNESFYDLGYYTSITTDVDCLADFYSISNAKYGYAITPNIGGGTNNSEFELLYSKSMSLLAGDAPFTYLEYELEKRSIVQYLEQLGYTTTGMHCGGETNYSRNIVYPALGFDNIFLGPDAFTYISDNGNRSWLDADNYNDLIDYYENVDDNPQFIYLLTFQNHGGYEQNDDDMDSVHVTEDFGDLTDDINEYLSSINLSAKSFKELTEYYSKVERDVIICMVGDHSPSFASSLTAKENTLIDDNSINLRTVPYVMWSNFDSEYSSYLDYVSMVDLVPMMLKEADVPLSTFYENILSLHENFPIRTSDGKCVDRNFILSTYDENNESYDLLKQYYYLEYNSLLLTDEYQESLFLP